MKTTLAKLALVLGFAVMLGGCTLPSSGRLVDRREAGQMRRPEMGTVERAQPVVLSGQRSQIGTLGGAAVGHASATNVGAGAGNEIARAGGAVVGAIAGDAVEEAVTRTNAFEYTIKMDSGQTVVVTQAANPSFNTGDRVRLLVGGTTTITAP